MKNKSTATILCFFLGWLGAHKFYLGKSGLGIIYLIFFWSYVPAIVAFIEFFMLLFMTDDEFNLQFNSDSSAPRQKDTSFDGDYEDAKSNVYVTDPSILQLPDGQTIELIAVSGDSFLMGSPEGQGASNEHPQHKVNVSSFSISKFPITQSQYEAVMDINPSYFKDKRDSGNRPVERVSWYDAQSFCQKLSRLTNQTVRLPSEAEWEYAARGGNQSKGYLYSGSNSFNEVAYDSEIADETYGVGDKKPNELGIYNMSGNIAEWCQDDFHFTYNSAPTNSSAWNGGEGLYPYGQQKVNRGGWWANSPTYWRVAARGSYDIEGRGEAVGFRIVSSFFN